MTNIVALILASVINSRVSSSTSSIAQSKSKEKYAFPCQFDGIAGSTSVK